MRNLFLCKRVLYIFLFFETKRKTPTLVPRKESSLTIQVYEKLCVNYNYSENGYESLHIIHLKKYVRNISNRLSKTVTVQRDTRSVLITKECRFFEPRGSNSFYIFS